LRELGFPVQQINVDDDQVDDRIDEALQLYGEYNNTNGVERINLAVQLTEAQISNNAIQVADSIIGVYRMFPIVGAQVTSMTAQGFNMFDINYQLRLNDMYSLISSSYVYYVIARQHLAMIDEIVTGEIPIRFNPKTRMLYMDTKLSNRVFPGDYVMFEASRIVDPEVYNKVYDDIWVKKYTAQLIKKQWGQNMKKYKNFALPGGIIIDAQQIYDEAVMELTQLKQELRDNYEIPPMMRIG
jgi:hypothetical protein